MQKGLLSLPFAFFQIEVGLPGSSASDVTPGTYESGAGAGGGGEVAFVEDVNDLLGLIEFVLLEGGTRGQAYPIIATCLVRKKNPILLKKNSSKFSLLPCTSLRIRFLTSSLVFPLFRHFGAF